ncbi:cobaltochelatase subunit CobN [Microbulbifer halophilus]|uniref:Cobaltochelatase subunit CobN n=1 Tax=Microbulbifer halophilus TaxID=453963 RepID=A0ABW5EF20_9GAMM|nr:cobaltochelatase subunit CobN [Microbulbifer halophilus]MCW8128030.1 cobaltochelatase subunit CobN [Microbulbifer halophilus]
MARQNRGGWLLILWLAACSAFAQVEPIKIGVVSNDFVLPGKISLLREIAQPRGIELTGYRIERSSGAPRTWFSQSDLVILDTPRGNDRARVMEFVGGALESTSTPWLAVGGGKPLGKNLPPQIMRPLLAYYGAGGETNFRHMMAFVQAWQSGQGTADVPAPQALPEAAFYHPQAPEHFERLSDYLDWGKKRWHRDTPVLAVAMSSGSVSDGETAAYDHLIRAIEDAGAVPLVFWYDRDAARPLTPLIADADPVMLVNTTHMMGEKLRRDLERLDIPVVMGLNYRGGSIREWRDAAQGLSAGSAAALMMVPESWGMSDPLVLTAIEDGTPEIIPEQVELLIGRFRAMARLRDARRDDLNIALLFWNTPSGERNLSASNLNVPRSIENILRGLEDSGYAVEPAQEREIISTAQRLLSAYYHPEKLDALLADGLAVTLPLDIYLSWLQSLPPAVREELEQAWGGPENHWSLRRIDGENHFVIPLARAGKLAILPQPPRADRLGESTHDLLQPPGHFYLATYLYLRRSFAADALIHLGTHGTQEWTPGKDRGLWARDYPNLAVSNVPVFYPYIQDNIGEAMQAKRRGRATVISHQTPPFAPSGFYGELRDIHDLMHRYLQLESGVVRDTTLASMLAKVEEHNLNRDLGWTPEEIRQRSDEFIPLLHDHLHTLAKSSTPVGLHSFGESATIEHRIATVMQQLGSDYYQALDLDQTEIFAASYDELFSEPAYQYLEPYLREEKAPSEARTDALQTLMAKAQIYHKKLEENNEIEALLTALRGDFVAPGAGGDPVRNPQTTSGTNLYALDPNKIPSREAYRAAETTFMELVTDYREKHGDQWPDKLAFSLWSSETIRTLGLSEAQIMHALGVRPVWSRGGRVTGLEIIPESELGHPRIDTLIQATSVYRDQFDGIMKKLARVIAELSRQDAGDTNPIARNSRRLALSLREQGLPAAEASRYAHARIFSNPPDDYGSGVTDVAMDSTGWEDDGVLADTFIRSQSHMYTEEDWGTPVQSLGLLESQLQGVDAVLLSRSSNLHGLLSTDHPYEYLGGLSSAVKKVTGENPRLYVSDARSKTASITGADAFLSSELRTRYQNPQWIEGMKAEGYAGTVQMLKVANNLFGWQVMDRNMVRDDQWQAMHDTYVMDRRDLELNQWFAEHNATAQAQLIERMMEAVRKGYWDASEQTRREMIERWQTLVDELGADAGAEKTVEFIQQQSAGFGLVSAAADQTGQPEDQAENQVKGQILEQVSAEPQQQPDANWLLWLAWFFLLACFTTGMARVLTRRRNFYYSSFGVQVGGSGPYDPLRDTL